MSIQQQNVSNELQQNFSFQKGHLYSHVLDYNKGVSELREILSKMQIPCWQILIQSWSLNIQHT